MKPTGREDFLRILRGALLVVSKIADSRASRALPTVRAPAAYLSRSNLTPPVAVFPSIASQRGSSEASSPNLVPASDASLGTLHQTHLATSDIPTAAKMALEQKQGSSIEPSTLEPEVHGLQGVTFLEKEPPSAAAPATPDKHIETQVLHPQRRKFVPRERAVPSSSIGRAFGFASLGATIILGTAKDSLSRAWKGKGKGGDGANGADQGDLTLYSAFISESNAERLASALCRMRGAALKLGQMLSIQDENVLPPQFAAALERVRAGADVMPRKQLEKVLVSELGKDWRHKVAEFDDSPMAAASIGQVHTATLHDGRKAVMKIQYPGVKKSIVSDVDNMMRLINLGNLLPKGLYIEEAVRVAKKELALECDYRYEAIAQARFADLVAADPYLSRHFFVPAVIPELSSETVLSTEYVPGVHIDQVAEMDQATRDAVGTRLLALTLTELYDWKFMQTDPNFGNFLYDAESDKLNLIDFGAAREYPATFVSEYLEMVRACAERNKEEIISRSIALGFLTGDESQVMMDAHVEAAIVVGTPFATDGVHDFGAHGELTRRITELGAVMLKHRLTPPPEASYSLHRKTAGAYLACIKLRARVPAKELFYAAYRKHCEAMGGGEQQAVEVAA